MMMTDTTPLVLRAVVAHTRRGGSMPSSTADVVKNGVRYIVLRDAADEVVGVYRVRKWRDDEVLVRLKRNRLP
jgi:hypothetical protein